MEEGSFRCDANISIRPENKSNSTAKVEVKNMNSFKAVYQALDYEARRQRKATAEGKKLVQETRGWLEAEGETVSQRSKEYAHDYRYFPEPDLPPLAVSREWVEEIRSKIPELPEDRRRRFIDEYQLPAYDADLLIGSKAMADYEEKFIAEGKATNLPVPEIAKLGSNWLLGEVSRIMNANNIDIVEFSEKISPERLVKMTALNINGTINTATAKSVLEDMFKTGQDAADIIEQRGLSQISDSQEIEKVVDQVIANNPDAVADYTAGKAQALTFLVGQVMKVTKGRANPKLVNEQLKVKLEEG